MTAARILNQAQAEAVYSAMCALNNSGFASNRVTAHSEENARWDVTVEWNDNSIAVYLGFIGSVESYANQAAFATAYSLNIKEAPVEPAAQSKCPGGADCGWDDKAKMGDICRVCGEQIPF